MPHHYPASKIHIFHINQGKQALDNTQDGFCMSFSCCANKDDLVYPSLTLSCCVERSRQNRPIGNVKIIPMWNRSMELWNKCCAWFSVNLLTRCLDHSSDVFGKLVIIVDLQETAWLLLCALLNKPCSLCYAPYALCYAMMCLSPGTLLLGSTSFVL
jgi:hypothetical protein